ncbi:MAG: hypothetical protein U0271_01230 [Polyangiaceae bacterium]
MEKDSEAKRPGSASGDSSEFVEPTALRALPEGRRDAETMPGQLRAYPLPPKVEATPAPEAPGANPTRPPASGAPSPISSDGAQRLALAPTQEFSTPARPETRDGSSRIGPHGTSPMRTPSVPVAPVAGAPGGVQDTVVDPVPFGTQMRSAGPTPPPAPAELLAELPTESAAAIESARRGARGTAVMENAERAPAVATPQTQPGGSGTAIGDVSGTVVGEPLDQSAATSPSRRPVVKSKSPAWLKPVVIGVVAFLALVLGVVVYVAIQWDSILRDRIAAESKDRGFEVKYKSLEVRGVMPWDSRKAVAILRDVSVSATEVEGVGAQAKEVSVTLGGTFPFLTPKRIKVTKIEIHAKDLKSLTALDRQARTGKASKTPIEVEDASITVDSVSDSLPVPGAVEAGRVAVGGGKARIEDAEIEVDIPLNTLSLGPTSATIEREDGTSWVHFDELPEIKLSIDEAGKSATLSIDALSSTRIRELTKLKVPPMTVSGSAIVDLANASGDPELSLDLTLEGWVPPHPKELDGVVFGNRTKVSGRVRRDGLSIGLAELKVEAGALKLKGDGSVSMLGRRVANITMSGTIPCKDLATSVLSAHLGGAAGMLAGQLANGRVNGDAAVTITAEVPLKDIEDATITPTATLSCSLAL